MSASMSVLSLKETGHVVAALANPEGAAPDLAALIGPGFPLRSVRRKPTAENEVLVELPESLIEKKNLELESRVLARPQSFVVNGDAVAEIPASDAPTVSRLRPSDIKISLPAAAAVDTAVIVLLRIDEEGDASQRVQSGTVVAGQDEVELTLKLAPDGPALGVPAGASCKVAIAAAGLPIGYATDVA